MGIVSILLLVLCVSSAAVLVVVILLQDEEGEGFGGLFGGASSTPFGSRSGNVLTKFTSVVAAVFLFGTFALAWVNRTPDSENIIGRARLESLRETQGEWWVQTGTGTAEDEGGGQETDGQETDGQETVGQDTGDQSIDAGNEAASDDDQSDVQSGQ